MAFVVTAGQLQAVQPSRGPHFGGWQPYGALTLSPTMTMSYERLWRTQPALRTVIGFLAHNLASLPLDVFTRISDTDRAKAADHPLAALLRRPVPGLPWTKYRLMSTLVHDLGLFDNAYWLKLRLDTGERAVQPIPPRMIRVRDRDAFKVNEFRITFGGGKFLDVPASEVVHFHGYDPEDLTAGVAPAETLRQILAEDYAATIYREQMWRNGARVSGYILRPKEAGQWSDTARSRFRTEWQAQYAGDGPATGGTPILEDGMDFKGSAFTPKDFQYIEARQLTREEVAVAYWINPVMLGLMTGATIGNVKDLHSMLYQDTLPPWMEQITQDIECQLLPDLDPAGADDGSVYVEFNIKAKLAGSFEEQASALQSATGGPWMTRNEARAMHNLSAVDGADELILPLNVIEGGLASPNDTAPDAPDNGPSNGEPPKSAVVDVLRAFFIRQERAVVAKLGHDVTGLDRVFDIGRWNAELADDLAMLGMVGRVGDINARTRAALSGPLASDGPADAVAALYAGWSTQDRAGQIADTLEWQP